MAQSPEICRLSLWIKTASRGKALTSLDHSIRPGNSVVADPAVHPRAFDWQAAFPEVFAAGGFDVVVGNPPYVRQELLGPIKPYLEEHYAAYHGMADLYVYFYELGLNVLKPGGLLSFIVTNKWMKAGYGEPLRNLLAERSWVESVVDFGHAKQIFEDADVFPSILVARKPPAAKGKTMVAKPKTARLCSIPREQLRIDDLSRQIAEQGSDLPLDQLSSGAWQLEPGGVSALLAKIKDRGVALRSLVDGLPMSGIKTGLNEAFQVSIALREKFIASDGPEAAGLFKPMLRGQDFERWVPAWAGDWLLVIASSENRDWAWSDRGAQAEAVFAEKFPAVFSHLNGFREGLVKRQDQGRFWWELRSCAYWNAFAQPKIMYQEITWRVSWAFDESGAVCNNTAYFLPSSDLWILAVVNSPVAWWYAWRTAMHGKDEALRYLKDFVRDFPIPSPTGEQRASAEAHVRRLIAIQKSQHETARTLLDWLAVEHAIEKPTQRLQGFNDLDSDGFVAEVKKIRGKKSPLSAAAVKSLRDEFAGTVEPAQALAREATGLEHAVSDLVNAAYGLAPAEIELMWVTAPPRMPISPSR